LATKSSDPETDEWVRKFASLEGESISLSQFIEDTTDREVHTEQTGKLVKDTSNFRESINGQSSPFPRYLSPTSLVLPY